MSDDASGYGLSGGESEREIPAPELAYLPSLPPQRPLPKRGLVGCGGISEYHLRAYRALGLEVVALCDVDKDRAEARRETFFPEAFVATDFRALIARDDVEIVDAATHVEIRGEIIEAALRA